MVDPQLLLILSLYYIFFFTSEIFPFLYIFTSYCSLFFSFYGRCINSSFRVVSVLINSFSFCLSEKFYFSLYLKWYSFWVEYPRIFPFSTFNVSYHSLLGCKLLAVKSTGSLMDSCKYDSLFFSCCHKNFFLICHFNYEMFFVSPLGLSCLGPVVLFVPGHVSFSMFW